MSDPGRANQGQANDTHRSREQDPSAPGGNAGRPAGDDRGEGQLRETAMLDSLPDIAWLKDREGRFVAVNAAFGAACGVSPAELPGKTDQDIWPPDLADGYRADDAEVIRTARRKRVDERLVGPDGQERWVETIKSPVLDDVGRVLGTAGTARDITERKQAEARLRHVTRLHAFLSQVNQTIVRTRDRDELFRSMCQVAVDFGQFHMAWVGLADEATGVVQPVTHAGHEAGYLQTLAIRFGEEPQGRGPTGSALRQAALTICDDIRSDPRMEPWREEALGRGYRSSAAIPFRSKGAVVGALSLYAAEPGFFVEDERRLLEEIGVAISFALDNLERESERRLAEHALRESERRYRSLFETMAQGVVYQDADGRIVSANPAAERILGVSLDQMQGRTSLDPRWRTIREDGSDLPGELHPAIEALGTGRPVLGATMGIFHPARNERRFILVDAVPEFRPGEARPHRVYATFSDITERRRAEEALRESEGQFKLFMRHLTGFAYLKDHERRILFLNERFEEAFAVPVKDWLGRTNDEIWPGEVGESIRRDDETVLSTGEPLVTEEVVPTKGEIRTYRTVKFPIPRPGQPPWLGGISIDITDGKRAEQERLELERRLLHAQKLESLGVLAGGIAHDFNNLLMAIQGHLELALRKLSAVSPARPNIEQSVQGAHRAAELTRQMLAYSGRGRFVIESLDLSELVEENAHLLRASVTRTATLDLRLGRSLPAIEADAGQVQQVVMNLITNASEAIGEGGAITVTTGVGECDIAVLKRSRIEDVPPPGAFVFLEVSDTGIGMDAETLARLFDPFFTTKATGRGLGMSAILGIVRGHRGAVLVDSAVGRGSTIRILFPASARAPVSRAAGAAAAWDGVAPRGGLVLVVDDEAPVREILREMVEACGMRVLVAADGHEAVEVFEQHADAIDRVILDLTMPRMDGVATLKELVRRKPGVRVILSSGYDEQESVQRLSGLGHAGFIQKPYTLDALCAALEKAGRS